MNIGALPELILSWLKNQGADLLRADKEQGLQGQFKPGQQYDAKVLEALPNGRSLVQVADQTLDMALPQQAKPGDVLRMTFVQSGPRPTFVLNASGAIPAPAVNVSQAAQQVSALIRYVPVAASAPAASVQAQAAQAQATPAGPAPTQPATVRSLPAQAAQPQPPTVAAGSNVATAAATVQAATAKPIVANPAILLTAAASNAGAVATAVAGPAIPVTMLTEEAVNSAHASAATNAGLGSAQGVVEEQATVTHLLPMRLQQTVKESGLFYESHLSKWVRGEVGMESIQREPQAGLAKTPGPLLNLPHLDGMPEKAAELASRQLNMLEGGPFVWLGQAWPGQHMEWQVIEGDGGGHASEREAQKWHSRLRLTLPRLGGMAADLDVGALGLRIRLSAQTPETEAEMKKALPELAQRMRDAELNLTSLNVEAGDGRA